MPLPTWYDCEPSHDISLCELESGVRERISLLASFNGGETASLPTTAQDSIDLASHLVFTLSLVSPLEYRPLNICCEYICYIDTVASPGSCCDGSESSFKLVYFF